MSAGLSLNYDILETMRPNQCCLAPLNGRPRSSHLGSRGYELSGSNVRSYVDVPQSPGGKIAIEQETPPLMCEETAAEPTDYEGSKSETGDMMKKWYSLIGKVYRPSNLEAAFCAVRANRGAPGVDRVTVEAYTWKRSWVSFITTLKPAYTNHSPS